MDLLIPAETLNRLEDLYYCGLEADSWYGSLQSLAEEVGAGGCVLFPEKAENVFGLRPSNELTDVLAGFVASGWHLHDHRSERGWRLARAGQSVILEHDITTDNERRTMPFYHEWAKPTGLPWWAAISFRVHGERWGMPLLRTERQGPFTPGDAHRLSQLIPHLERALGFAHRLASGQANARLDVLERLGCGCFLLDWRGSVSRRNGAADMILGRDLALCHGRLVAHDKESDRHLQALVRRAVQGEDTSEAMRVPVRRLNSPPLVVEAMHVSSGITELFLGSTAVLLVEEARPRSVMPADVLGEAFALTPAEARLAVLVGGGDELSKAAEVLGIAKGTARSQLKAIFMKTGARRQAELVSKFSPYRR